MSETDKEYMDPMLVIGLVFVIFTIVSFYIKSHSHTLLFLTHNFLKPIAHINIWLDAIGITHLSELVMGIHQHG